MINVNELKAAIVRKGMTQFQVANKLGITPRTFSSKLNIGVFYSDEMEKMIDILDIENPMQIFFGR